jgi:pimeloyl-ACP methyl ester carboxylesterase
MERRDAYVREAGAGVPLVCIHASASSSSQWRPLMDRLAGRFRTLAVDLHGSGKSPDWPADRPLTLADEVALLEPIFRNVGDRFHLIGHSYGGRLRSRQPSPSQGG